VNRRTAILLILLLVAAYAGSYLCYSRDGLFVPKAWGAGVTPEGLNVIRSKRLGKVWQPFGIKVSDYREFQENGIREMVYLPLIFLDRLLWHRDQPETEDSVLWDYH